ncbi:helix-turn-helix transcriptional regulator [Clostridium sp.]|uniref:helix-turn-helix transcriptional regulator n=1 Tax=Clostridium sp. TaxID=1506 RepID=UPI0039965179
MKINIFTSKGGIDIKNRIKELRELKLLTQEDLGKRTGLPQTKVSRIESDSGFEKTRIWQLQKIAAALNVEIIELFDLSDMTENSLIKTITYLKNRLEL